ncbi:hypothetical protein CXIVA_24330 [Clostridium sp. SY8519]|uniref:hypothetical protein n=1 Tax=Clostridium sp. (strain SY8519) TaxID=1042156 RepID=UPI0002172264|nr:hypothetical protein [Clostridium sp. SY8519]BAK48400.1 hypothetical protein CXIVA_24330 [Clostridium sp. SY8519]
MRKKGIFKKLFCMLLAAVLICTLTPPLTAAEKPAAGEQQTIHREQPADVSGTEASEAARKETAAVTEAGKADPAEEPADSTPAAAEKKSRTYRNLLQRLTGKEKSSRISRSSRRQNKRPGLQRPEERQYCRRPRAQTGKPERRL